MSDQPAKAKLRKKGGAIFPRIALQDAVVFAMKLVSKTHAGPQPRGTIYPGVFGSTGSTGEVRASALKQYGLLEGKSEALKATELAKKIAVAPEAEKLVHYGAAAIKPRIFLELFRTFHGDTVTLAKLKQRAAQCDVHPDEAERAAKLFCESAVFGGLGKMDGDSIALVSNGVAPEHAVEVDSPGVRNDQAEDIVEEPVNDLHSSRGAARSGIQVHVTIDSSLDTEKLEKQLAILRKYGAL